MDDISFDEKECRILCKKCHHYKSLSCFIRKIKKTAMIGHYKNIESIRYITRTYVNCDTCREK